MATSGEHNVTVTAYNTLRFKWERTSYSIENNTSTVAWEMILIARSDGEIISGVSKDWAVTVNGQRVSGSAFINIKPDTRKTIASGTVVIPHNDDGTKVVSYKFRLNFAITFSGEYIGDKGASGSFTLDTIPRASSFTVSSDSANMGTPVTFNITRASTAFTHKLTLSWGDALSTIASNVATSVEWTIPLTLAADIPNSKSSGCIITCITYNGSTEIGRKTLSMTLNVPVIRPSIKTVAVSEATTGLASKFGVFVQNKTKFKVEIGATGANYATIKSYSTKILGRTYTGSTFTSNVITASGSVDVEVTVTDSRGFANSFTQKVTVTAYSDPSISTFTAERCDENGNLSDEGEYVKLTVAFAVDALSNKNDKSYTIAYKPKEDADFTTLTSGSVYTLSTTYIPTITFDGDNSYDFILTVTDYFKPVSQIADISTAFSLTDYHSSGTGIAFGKVSEIENTLENALELRQIANSYAFQPSAFNGEKGYTLLAVIKLNTLNVNAPIVFEINRRGALCPMRVYVRFASSSTSTDPDLGSITYEGDNFGAFLVKTAASTWSLYVDNTSGWSNPCLQKWYTTNNQMSRLAVTFPQGQIATLPTPYYRATPIVSRSILDCFFSVGSIIVRYDHADPNSMFPGTTWVRIANRFLWGCDADGDIGVIGGSKTHSLTVNELPAHNHGGTYTNAGTSRTHAWLTSNGSAMGYDSVSVGGGAAHNNMPPYIHVSIWRRTA